MKVIRKVLLWSLLLWIPAILAAACYGYYWYQVSQLAENMRQRLAPVAAFEYASQEADLDGAIAFNQVSLKPVQGPEVKLEQLRLIAPDAWFWLTAEQQLQQGDWPASLQLQLSGLQLPVTDQMLAVVPAQTIQDPQALACGDLRQLTAKEWRAMGYRKLMLDMQLTFNQVASQRLQVEMSADVAQAGKLQVQMRSSYRGQPTDAQSLMQADPQLELLTFSYQDGGYNKRRNRFCAAASGLQQDAYSEAYRQALIDWLAQVFELRMPDAVLDAYMQLQQPGARLHVSMRPQLNPMQLAVQPPPVAQLLEQLQLKVSINRQGFDWQQLLNARPVEEESLAAQLNNILPDAQPLKTPDVPVATSSQAAEDLFANEAQAAQPVKVERQPGYRTVPWAELADWVGHPVRVRTSLGRLVQGDLQKFAGNRIQILYRVEQGSAVFPISRNRIKSIEVYDSGR